VFIEAGTVFIEAGTVFIEAGTGSSVSAQKVVAGLSVDFVISVPPTPHLPKILA